MPLSSQSQRAKVSLPPLLFQMFSNSDCYTNKDKSKSSTIISQKILTIGKWLETVWTETNVDEFDYFFLTQYPSYSCQKLPWKFFSKKSNRYFAWKFSSIAMLSKEKYCTGMTRRFTVAGFCWAALYGPCCKCCFGRRPVKKLCWSKTVKHRKRKAAVAAGAEPAVALTAWRCPRSDRPRRGTHSRHRRPGPIQDAHGALHEACHAVRGRPH